MKIGKDDIIIEPEHLESELGNLFNGNKQLGEFIKIIQEKYFNSVISFWIFKILIFFCSMFRKDQN